MKSCQTQAWSVTMKRVSYHQHCLNLCFKLVWWYQVAYSLRPDHCLRFMCQGSNINSRIVPPAFNRIFTRLYVLFFPTQTRNLLDTFLMMQASNRRPWVMHRQRETHSSDSSSCDVLTLESFMDRWGNGTAHNVAACSLHEARWCHTLSRFRVVQLRAETLRSAPRSKDRQTDRLCR